MKYVKQLINQPSLLMLTACFSIFGFACKSDFENGLLAYDDLPGDLYISLAHPSENAEDDFEIAVSTPRTTYSVSICEVDSVAGTCGTEVTSQLIYTTEQRSFFVSNYPLLLKEGLIITLIARDNSNQVMDMRTITFSSVSDYGNGRGLDQNPSTASNGATLERNYCAVAGCHSNYATYSNTQKADAISSGRMPRNQSLSLQDRETLLKYFQGV